QGQESPQVKLPPSPLRQKDAGDLDLQNTDLFEQNEPGQSSFEQKESARVNNLGADIMQESRKSLVQPWTKDQESELQQLKEQLSAALKKKQEADDAIQLAKQQLDAVQQQTSQVNILVDQQVALQEQINTQLQPQQEQSEAERVQIEKKVKALSKLKEDNNAAYDSQLETNNQSISQQEDNQQWEITDEEEIEREKREQEARRQQEENENAQSETYLINQQIKEQEEQERKQREEDEEDERRRIEDEKRRRDYDEKERKRVQEEQEEEQRRKAVEEQNINEDENELTKGNVIITIFGVKNVAAMDSNGKSDPFIELMLNGQKQKTKKQKDTLNAEFNETFQFNYDGFETSGEKGISLELWDYDTIGDNDQIGKVEIPV
ncbi:MAG: hypothetical protein EZS28_043260, partial [Streblomastix strix]